MNRRKCPNCGGVVGSRYDPERGRVTEQWCARTRTTFHDSGEPAIISDARCGWTWRSGDHRKGADGGE